MAISAVASPSTWSTVKKVLNTGANFIFGSGQNDVFAKTFVTSVKKDGIQEFRAAGKTAYETSKLGESFLGATKKLFSAETIKGLEGEVRLDKVTEAVVKNGMVGDAADAAITAAETAKVGFGAKAFKFLGKGAPLIGNLIMLAMEAPNLVNAFTDTKHGGGLGTGLKETGKFIIKQGMFSLGSLIGGLVPVPGLNVVTSMAGGMLMGALGDKLVGASFTDQAKEADAKAAIATTNPTDTATITTPSETTTSPATNPAAAMVYQQSNPYMNGMDYNSLAYNKSLSSMQDYRDKDFYGMSLGYVA